MNNEPLVSIVITSFNRLPDIKEGIEKLKDIKYSNLEFIIVDGGSTDGSAEYISKLKINNLVTIILGVNKGNCFTTNEGMKNAKGKYIIIIDDDAYLNPFVVKKTVEIFEHNSNLGSIGYGLINPTDTTISSNYFDEVCFNIVKNQFANSYQSIIYGSASAYRKEVLEKVGFFDLSWNWGTGGEDNELNFKIIAHGHNTVLIPELVAYHKISSSTRASREFTKNITKSFVWILLKFYPRKLMFIKLIQLFCQVIYYSILFKDHIYISGLLSSAHKANKMLKYPKKIPYTIAKDLHLSFEWLFSHDREIETL